MYDYKGYSYRPWDDIEPNENHKVYHEVYVRDCDKDISVRNMPLGPYTSPTEAIFRMWIDCGKPTNKDMKVNGNASEKDIADYYYKYMDGKVDNILLGVNDES